MPPITTLRAATLLLSVSLCLSCKIEPGGGGDGDGDTDTSTDTGACEGFADVQADAPVEVLVRNDRAEPIYLPGWGDCTFNYVHVTGVDGYWPWASCDYSCEMLMAGNCACEESCPTPQLLRIEPGGEYPLDWSYLLIPDSVPESCVPTQMCQGGACPRSVAPPDGDYTISAAVSLMPAGCEDDGTDPCACPGPESWCMTDMFIEGAPADLTVEAPATLPADGPLVLTVE